MSKSANKQGDTAKIKKPCGHDFGQHNKKKCGICGKRRPARMGFPAKKV